MNNKHPVQELDALTDREQEILTLIEAGLSNHAIAEELVLSYHTVTWYIKQIFSKLGVNRRTQAVTVGRSLGYLRGAVKSMPRSEKRHNLPSQATSFIGRKNETKKIISLLDDPNCRLVTLVGPGGIGKTRLGLEVAGRLVDNYDNGVFYVALQPLTSPEEIIPTIANSLDIKLQSNRQNPSKPLFDFFREKAILLLLDNFEHLLDGVLIISNLLAAAPDVKVLVTSRESLNLREEYLFNVSGLTFPKRVAHDWAKTKESFQAVELFTERACQICPDFSLVDTFPDVVEICRLVAGMPLAIELAASWLKTLSCQEIAAGIQKGLDALVTTMRNVPERHRSIWATFDASWHTLDEGERKVFRRLSVFRGGCTRESASEITGANRWTLQSLADKSFIRRDVRQNRFDIHELLRQYGEQRLEHSKDEVKEAHARHSTYFSELLAGHREDIVGPGQLEMMQELEPELDNIRKAWRWAVNHDQVGDILKSVHTLAYFHVFRGRFLEEADAFERAIESLESQMPDQSHLLAIAVLLSYLGWIYIRIGEYELTETSFRRSQILYQQANEPPPPGLGTEPLTGLAMLACIRGDYTEAIKLGQETCRLSNERFDPLNYGLGEYAMISAYFHQGVYETARELAEDWLTTGRERGGMWHLADPLNAMGNICRVMGEYDQARKYYQESYEIRQTFNDPQGMAAACNFMGMTAVSEGDPAAARQYYQESYKLYSEIGDRGGVGYALCGLASTALVIGDQQEAQHHFFQALELVSSIHYMPVIFLTLIGISELMLAYGDKNRAIEILTLIYNHEQCDHEAREKVQEILNNVPTSIDSEIYQSASNFGAEPDLDHIVQYLLEEQATVGL